MLKQAKNKGDLFACEISDEDYVFLKWLPQYVFWEDANLVHGLLHSGIDGENLKWACTPNDWFCGIPCKLKGKETKAILKNGVELRMSRSNLFFGWLEATFNPKISF